MKRRGAALLLLLASAAGCSAPETPAARAGSFDLSNPGFDFRVTLDGEWEAYPGRLLTPAEVRSAPRPGYFRMPSVWNKKQVGDYVFQGADCATFRLVVKGLKSGSYALRTQEFGSSARLFVNGRVVLRIGDPGTTRETTIPDARPGLAFFDHRGGDLEVVLQVANFHHRKGGVYYPIELGTHRPLLQRVYIARGTELLVIGALFIMALYHFGLFLLHRSDKSSLLFAALTTAFAVRAASTGQRIIQDIFPWFSYDAFYRIEYLTFLSPLPLVLYFFRNHFPTEIPLWYPRVHAAISALFVIVVLAFPANVFTYTAPPYQVILLAGASWTVVYVTRSVKHGRAGAVPYMVGGLILLTASANDVLHTNKIIFTYEIAPFGVFAFTLAQSLVIASRSIENLRLATRLSEELEQANHSLESRVVERTAEAVTARETAETALKARNEFLGTMSHEIRTPLTIILGLTEVLRESGLREDQIELLTRVEHSGRELLETFNEILDFARLESGQAKAVEDLFALPDLINVHVRRTEELARTSGLTLGIEMSHLPDLLVGDGSALARILGILLSNAVKFTERGSVMLRAREGTRTKDEVEIIFEIEDTGIGIPPDRMDRIFRPFSQLDAGSARRFGGTGLGLAICHRLCLLMKGSIRVQSTLGKGSTFTVVLPFRLEHG